VDFLTPSMNVVQQWINSAIIVLSFRILQECVGRS
jgi:hypothetical protein